jgi:hypothetical protein
VEDQKLPIPGARYMRLPLVGGEVIEVGEAF